MVVCMNRVHSMKFSEIAAYPNPWPQDTHPVLGHIVIERRLYNQLTERVAQQTQVRLLGHDEADDGLLVVHVACTTEMARDFFSRRWSV
jgi:hypothetical protein